MGGSSLLPLRRAARLREGGGCFGEISRCAGLLDREREEAAALGGAPAARGCSIRRKEEAAPSWGDPAARGCSTERGRKLREAYTNYSGNHGTKPEKY